MTTRKQLQLERTFDADLEDVWALWTTKAGIESWWGPVGFTIDVKVLELRAGGALEYVMTAFGPNQVAFMKRAGQPLSTTTRNTYTLVEPMRVLGWKTKADFIPGVAPYDVETRLELSAVATGVHLRLQFDAMHDEHWNKLATMGREEELQKLAQLLAAKKGNS